MHLPEQTLRLREISSRNGRVFCDRHYTSKSNRIQEPKMRHVRRHSRAPFSRSRPGLEILEDRTLLAGLMNSTIAAAQQQALVDGLQALTTWGATLGQFGALDRAI